MKKFLLAVLVGVMALTMVSSAMAKELWDWHLQGADEGLAYGALPPPGLYFINDFFWTGNAKSFNRLGNNDTGVKLNAYVDVPILLWNPGICPILGATYACGIAQPFDQTLLRAQTPGVGWVGNSQWGAYQTIIIPFILSWDIPCNLHVSASLAIGLNTGTTSPGDSLAADRNSPLYHQYGAQVLGRDGGLYAWSSSDNYTFNPQLGISWLYGGWNLSAEYIYTFWTKDTDCDIQNGDELYQEYTATYTCGKWTFGLGAAGNNQVFNDKGYIGTVYQKIPNSMAMSWTAGPIIGYNFGPCSILCTYNFQLSCKNDIGGDFFLMRLVVPLGNPYTWYK